MQYYQISEHATFNERMNPYNIANERATTWPEMRAECDNFVQIYTAVKKTGLPNMLKARVPLESTINIENWRGWPQAINMTNGC